MLDPYRMIVVNLIISAILIAGLLLYTKVYPKKRINFLFLLIIISLLPLVSILRIGSYESGDLNFHVKFAMQFFENLKQGQLIPAWIEKQCSGYGCPDFIFTFLLSHYLISIIHVLGFSFITSAKILIAISFILSGIGMYLWMKDEFGDKSGFAAAVFYLFAPYHLIDLHFRVSIAELVSMAILPFLFLTTKRFVETRYSIFFIYTSILFALLILSHQVTSLASFPFLIIYGFSVWLRYKKKNIKILLHMIFAFINGLLLTAFYWIPVLIESKYTAYGTEVVISFHSFRDFFYPPNLFGLLFQGNKGEIYTSIGYTQWLVVFIGIFILLKKKVHGKAKIVLTSSIIIFFILFLMMQSFTKPLWDIIPIINNFQFSWRLSIQVIIVIGVIAAIVIKTYTNKKFFILLCFITIAYTILNWGNRKAMPQTADAVLRNQMVFDDYIGQVNALTPIWVDKYKPWIGKIPNKHIEILSGNAEIVELSHLITNHEYIISAKSKVELKENTYYFPGWKVLVDNIETQINYKNKHYPGVIIFKLGKGLHKVEVIFTDSLERRIAKWISALSATVLGIALIIRLKRFIPKRQI